MSEIIRVNTHLQLACLMMECRFKAMLTLPIVSENDKTSDQCHESDSCKLPEMDDDNPLR